MKKIFFLFFIIGSFCLAQMKTDLKLTGRLSLDSKISFDETANSSFYYAPDIPNRKSPLLAAALSLAVPGAGEFYSESYLKSALFVAAEAAAITIGLIYDKKGDDQTTYFQNYANRHWDVKRYARWTIKNASAINPAVDVTKYNLFDNSGNVNWKELNRLESDLGGYYSHRLAPHGDQQYYEMIGKYPQFNVGWDDFGDENTPFTYGDPLTPRFLEYSRERGKANDFYNIASTAVIIVIANHILSSVDAAWTASRHNKQLELSLDLKKLELGFRNYYYPQLNLQYTF